VNKTPTQALLKSNLKTSLQLGWRLQLPTQRAWITRWVIVY